jgi:hypothetical protein
MSDRRAASFTLGIMSLTSDRPGLKFLLLIKMTQDDPRRHFVIHADNATRHCAKTVPLFLDHNSYAKHLIFLIRQIWLPQTFGFSGI